MFGETISKSGLSFLSKKKSEHEASNLEMKCFRIKTSYIDQTCELFKFCNRTAPQSRITVENPKSEIDFGS